MLDFQSRPEKTLILA